MTIINATIDGQPRIFATQGRASMYDVLQQAGLTAYDDQQNMVIVLNDSEIFTPQLLTSDRARRSTLEQMQHLLVDETSVIRITTTVDVTRPTRLSRWALNISGLMGMIQHPTYIRHTALPDTFGSEPIDAVDTATQPGLTLVFGGGLPNWPEEGSAPRTVVLDVGRIVGVVARGPNESTRAQDWVTSVEAEWSKLPEVQTRVDDAARQTLSQMFFSDNDASQAMSIRQYTEIVEQQIRTRAATVERLEALRHHDVARAAREGQSEAQRTIDSLLAMPKVLDVKIHGENIDIRTTRLRCPNRDDNTVREMGAYIIRINCEDPTSAQVRWRNITRSVGSADHPHIRDGEPCLGNLYEMLVPLLSQRNISAIAAMAIQFAENADPNDGWGESIVRWPLVDSERALGATGRPSFEEEEEISGHEEEEEPEPEEEDPDNGGW